jgi:aspartate/methionine/tyrosine aminotransferase
LLALADADRTALDGVRLGYSQSDGTDDLRGAIAALYPGATEQNVIVTVGSSEANFIICWTLIRQGDAVAILEPTYRQTWGLAQNFGARVATFALSPELGWDLDPDHIERAIPTGTKLVVVTNPNNPTGRVLPDMTRQTILERARAAGAWLLCDEVYAGAELAAGEPTQSFWGGYDRTIVVSGLSKAYGLPGLRIGWIVAPPEFKRELFARHDYTVICPPPLSDYLARMALGVREQILQRTRTILQKNYAELEAWLNGFDGAVDWWKPECGAICLVRYHSSLGALDLAERIRSDQSILLAPGDHFGLPHCIRMGYGNDPTELRGALRQLGPALRAIVRD